MHMKTNKGSVLAIVLIVVLIVLTGGFAYLAGKKGNTNPTSPSQNYSVNIPSTDENVETNTNVVPNATSTTPVNTQTNNVNTAPKTGVSHCGLTINSPQPNSVIHSNVPVNFSGVIDNTNSGANGCSWGMFEGQAGTAQLWHKDGGVWGMINSPKIIKVTNWMTNGPIPFTVSVDFNNSGPGFASGLPMKVVFTEENPSGGTADTLEFPLVFQ